MKRILLILIFGALCCAGTACLVLRALNARHADEVAALQNAWQQERDALAAQRENTPATVESLVARQPSITPSAPSTARPDYPAIVARLAALNTAKGASPEKTARRAIHDFEELIAGGPAALPAIRGYLARPDDVDFTALSSEWGKRRAVPDSFILPPTLRFGLLDAARQIGGADGEALLAEVLSATSRGAEVAWLARTLNALAPDKYRDAALAAARGGLANPRMAADGKGIDRADREQLFSVLTMFGDATYASTAQSQIVLGDNTVDRGALKYLMETLGPQAVPVVAQLYSDPRLSDPAQREPLARLALNYVGADAQANDFYQKAINDSALSKDDRRNLIEDLNQDGFQNRKKLTETDLPLIENRIALIEQLAPSATDPVNLAAFKEAYKDLVNMRERVLHPPPAVPKK